MVNVTVIKIINLAFSRREVSSLLSVASKIQGKKWGVNMMLDQDFLRFQMVKRILCAMDSDFAIGDEGSLWINDGQYQILLPDQTTSEVIIRFSKNLYPAAVADIAARFSGVATLMGLDVCFTGWFDPDDDSTGVVLIQEDV